MSKAITKEIIEKGADYVIAVKGNQAHLMDDIKEAFSQTPATISATILETGQ